LAALTSKIEGKTISPVDEVALAEAVKNPKINKAILEILTKDGVEHGLRGFEMVKRIHLSMNPFSVENNTLTPTMKLRRKDAYKLYKAELDALYALGEPQLSSGFTPKL